VLGGVLKVYETGASPVALSENIEAEPADLVRVVKEFGFEGILAKRKDSFYESGKRTGAWVKYRVNRSQEFVIGGYTRGNPLDALNSRVLPRRKPALRRQGEEWLCAAPSP
jgi:ATP-dependent DNA ligase